MNKLKNIVFLFFCAYLLTFCKRNPTTWNDDIVAPLANGSLTLGNLFPDTVIKTNTDSSLVIAFQSNLINYQLDSLLKIRDTTITETSISPFTSTISPGQIIPSATQPPTQYFLPNGIQLRLAIIKQGTVKVVMQNTVREPLVYVYELTSATKAGVVLNKTFNIPAAPNKNTASTFTANIDLTGYTINLTGTGNTVNTVIQNGTVSIAPSPFAHNDTLFAGEGLTSNFTFEQIVPQYAQGYFGNQQITVGPDTANFSVFNSIKKGILDLNSATVNFSINNEIGVAMQASISNISSINTNNPSSIPLTYTNVQLSNVNIPAAHDNNGPNNPFINLSTSPKNFTLNNLNSDITTFIGNLPGKLSYKLIAQINPGGNQSGNTDFGYYGTGFTANLNMNVPLYFSASNLLLADTLSLNLSNVSQLQNINNGKLILTANNSYPFSIQLSAMLLDANKHMIASLFDSPGLIQAPSLDMNGKVVAPVQSKLYIPLTSQKITDLQKARYIAYSATFNTVNQPNRIKFYSDYSLGLLLTADINYTIGK